MQLLLETDYTIDGIASSCGLTNRLRLQRVFRRRLSCTPAEWRRLNAGKSINDFPPVFQ